MISFESDYIAGAHPKVLQRLIETNLQIHPGYGNDDLCRSAAEKIRTACDAPDAAVFFLTGGTQTNQVVISTMLSHWEGVVAATTGHVSIHEAGAIEHTGHKVLEIPSREGKIDASGLDRFVSEFHADANHEHMVFPGMAYISHPTEYGTLYSHDELKCIAEVCHRHSMRLYLDGARLAYALASPESDVTLADIAKLCDVFSIGGTKAGALCGEAVVFPRGNAPAHFVTLVKQHGALLAKGRLLGAQFDALFSDGLFPEIGAHAGSMALRLRTVLHAKGYRFFLETPTNQQFVILENSRMRELAENVGFSFWEKYDAEHTVVRFAVSWSTTDEDLMELERLL